MPIRVSIEFTIHTLFNCFEANNIFYFWDGVRDKVGIGVRNRGGLGFVFCSCTLELKQSTLREETRPDTRPIVSRWRVGRGSDASGQGQCVGGQELLYG